MRYIKNKLPNPHAYAVTTKAKELRTEYLTGLTDDVRTRLQDAATRGFDALVRFIGPETAAEQRRRRKAQTREPYVLGNVQGVRMTIPAHASKRRYA